MRVKNRDIFWAIILLLGRFPSELVLIKYPHIGFIGLLTFWSALVIWAEIYYADKLIVISGLLNLKWVKILRTNKADNNIEIILRMKKLVRWLFLHFKLPTLAFLTAVPFTTCVACALYSLAQPRYGRRALVLGVFIRLTYIYLAAEKFL